MGTVKWVGGFSGSETYVNHTGNYFPTALPITGDDLFIEAPTGSAYSMAVNLTTLQAVVLNTLNVSQTFTANIGTVSGYLKVSATTTLIGYQYGGTTAPASGSGMIRIDFGTNSGTTTVVNTASSSNLNGAGPVTLLGTHTTNSLTVIKGTVSVAIDPTESSKFQTVNNSGALQFGAGVTLTTVNVNGGSILIQSGMTTLTQYGGVVTIVGGGTIGTFTQTAGSAALSNSGTITNLKVFGSVDFTQSDTTRTVTNCTASGNNWSINVANAQKGSIIFTNNITTTGPLNLSGLRVWPTSTIALS